MPKVSILMNAYNSEKYLQATFDSLRVQSYQDFEIIFIDNCSTDQTQKMAKSYGPQLKYFKTPQNMSLYAARKFGLPKISGKFFCVLDTDDLWHPQKLKFQVALCESKKLDFLFTNYSFILENYPLWKRFLLPFLHLKKNLELLGRGTGPRSFTSLIKNYDINLQTVMIRTSKIQDLNFNENLNLLGDFEFFLKLIKLHQITPFYTHHNLAQVRLHPGRLTQKLKDKWYDEITYLKDEVFAPHLNEQEQQAFNNLILIYEIQKLAHHKQNKEIRQKLKEMNIHSLDHTLFYLKNFLSGLMPKK